MKRENSVKPDFIDHVDSFVSFSGRAIHTPAVLRKLEKELKQRLQPSSQAAKATSRISKKKPKA